MGGCIVGNLWTEGSPRSDSADLMPTGFKATADRCRQTGWPVLEIDCGHDAMIIKPRELAELLLSPIASDLTAPYPCAQILLHDAGAVAHYSHGTARRNCFREEGLSEPKAVSCQG
jgi:hypothetical protein